jgi:asparagine synthase (glutamine-hydrolysing)
MFAIAIWDDATRALFLIRDRLGVKPLVYAARDGSLAFASTVRALRQAEFASALDPQAVVEYLEFGFVTDARSIYRGISKVQAGTIVEWSADGIRSRPYWPSVTRSCNAPSFEEAVEETERLFLRAVEIRLFADVKVGSLLSGGIDSGLVCWAISKLGGDITAFTVGTPGDGWDETADASATARALGLDHRILPITPEDSPGVEELASAYGEPFACASALGMLEVSRAVRDCATVLLTGDGGDDAFLGYPRHRSLWTAQRLAKRLPPGSSTFWRVARRMVSEAGFSGRLRHLLDFASGGLGAVTEAQDGLPFYRRTAMLGDALAEASLPQREIPWSLAAARNLLEEFISYERNHGFVGEYMTKVDGATMYYGLEARSPFLDHKLWEFADSIPVETHLHGGQLKAVLRELARRRIGERTAAGRKRGFGVPVQRWLADGWRVRFEESLDGSELERQGLIRAKAVQEGIRKTAPKGIVPQQLWYLFVLEAWLRYEQQNCTAGVNALLGHAPADLSQ